MLTKEELLELLRDVESSRVERTVSTSDTDKFCEAVCAFANDMPDSRAKVRRERIKVRRGRAKVRRARSKVYQLLPKVHQ